MTAEPKPYTTRHLHPVEPLALPEEAVRRCGQMQAPMCVLVPFFQLWACAITYRKGKHPLSQVCFPKRGDTCEARQVLLGSDLLASAWLHYEYDHCYHEGLES